MVERFFITSEDSLLLIIDIQVKLAEVMDVKDKIIENVDHLIELAKLRNIPIVLTEQYPKGLGQTVERIRNSLPVYKPFEKLSFSCCNENTFFDLIKSFNRKRIVVTGMETHVCVLQTSLDLIKEGFYVHVVQDAVCSRAKQNWKIALEFMRDAGAVITSTETVLFQWLKVAGTEEFKKIIKRIK